MLSGQENYRRAIEFGSPAWVPVRLHCPFEALYDQDEEKKARVRELARLLPDDLLSLTPDYTPVRPVEKVGESLRWIDHWGTGWVDDGYGAKTDHHPLEGGYDLMEEYSFPDAHDPAVYASADHALAERGRRYVLAPVWFTLFERMWMLRGFDNMLLDPYTEHAGFACLQKHVLEYALGCVDEWLKREVDGVFFSDDWGGQHGLLIHPDDWRRYWRPAYAALFSRVRNAGAHVWMHLCGDIRAILPDLIDLGLNVLNPVQPRAMPIRELAAEFGERVCFYGGVDVQGVLSSGTPQQVDAHVRELLGVFALPSGGYILSTSHGIMPETPLDNVIALYNRAVHVCGQAP